MKLEHDREVQRFHQLTYEYHVIRIQRMRALRRYHRRVQVRSELLDRFAALAESESQIRQGALAYVPGTNGVYHAVKPPRTFSFIDNPAETMKFFNKLVGLIIGNTTSLHIDQSDQFDVEIGAGLLLNVIAREAGKSLRANFSGKMPRHLEALQIVQATGLPALLARGWTPTQDVKVFRVRRGRELNQGGDKSSLKEVTAQRFIEYLDECFAENHCFLAIEDKQHLFSIIGEVLANAEDHGDGTWWIAGYMMPASAAVPMSQCHLALLNFGPSIAQTLQQMQDGPTRQEIVALVNSHRRRNLFRHGWTPEGLWTFYALQEKISRRVGKKDKIPGMGLTDLMEAFWKLGQSATPENQPSMCLLSGHTHLYFDGRFPIEFDADERRVVTLNTARSLSDPPDKDVVQYLPTPFPGTLVSIRFFLDANAHPAQAA